MIFGSDGLNYMGAPVLVRAQFIFAVLACRVVLMGSIEAYCENGGPFGGRALDVVYPGGKRFDPLGLAYDFNMPAELKVKEITNGRLAMFFVFGYYVLAAVTGQGTVENRASHIVDLFAVNGLIREIVTEYKPSPSVTMFVAAGKKKEAAPKVDLSCWYGPDRKKWLGPNTADSYIFDNFIGEYPGEYGWDSARPAAGPKTFEPARG